MNNIWTICISKKKKKQNKNRYRLKHNKAVKIYFIVFTYIFLPFWFPARRWHTTIPLLIGKDYEQFRALKSEDRDISRFSCTMSDLIFQWPYCWKDRSKKLGGRGRGVMAREEQGEFPIQSPRRIPNWGII